MRTALVIFTLSVVGGALFWYRSNEQARLLRADPALLPQDAALMRFAAGRGQSLFVDHCATCHAANGRGDSTRGIPNLTDADWLYGEGVITDIEKVVDYGIRSYNARAWNLAVMPAYARAQPSATETKIPPLPPAGIRDVVEYLLYLQRRPADNAAGMRGAQIYNGVGGCYDCHSADAAGDAAIGAPNLTDHITLYGDGSRQALFNSVAYGHQGICPAWIDRLSAAEIREISVYVYSISHRPPTGAAKS